jgi:hypothetical protein
MTSLIALPVTDVEQGRSLLADVKAAGLSATARPIEHQDPFFVKLAVLVGHHAEVVPGVQPTAVALRHPLQPPEGAGTRPADVHELDLGMRPVRPAEVAAFPGRNDRAHEIQ